MHLQYYATQKTLGFGEIFAWFLIEYATQLGRHIASSVRRILKRGGEPETSENLKGT